MRGLGREGVLVPCLLETDGRVGSVLGRDGARRPRRAVSLCTQFSPGQRVNCGPITKGLTFLHHTGVLWWPVKRKRGRDQTYLCHRLWAVQELGKEQLLWISSYTATT